MSLLDQTAPQTCLVEPGADVAAGVADQKPQATIGSRDRAICSLADTGAGMNQHALALREGRRTRVVSTTPTLKLPAPDQIRVAG
jgi:hypothetical protein